MALDGAPGRARRLRGYVIREVISPPRRVEQFAFLRRVFSGEQERSVRPARGEFARLRPSAPFAGFFLAAGRAPSPGLSRWADTSRRAWVRGAQAHAAFARDDALARTHARTYACVDACMDARAETGRAAGCGGGTGHNERPPVRPGPRCKVPPRSSIHLSFKKKGKFPAPPRTERDRDRQTESRGRRRAGHGARSGPGGDGGGGGGGTRVRARAP